ncbi:MAG TPA: hypothetical protein VEC37_18380 [Bacillota bacterium]|nr:hypothetical protein [Bacillota bacterium]
MDNLQMPSEEAVYSVERDNLVIFNQLALKIEMDSVTNEAYYAWLDEMKATIGQLVAGAEIAEKENARMTPPLNTAIYYDTDDYQILPTGALLRTSCNVITHAFCAFKKAQDAHSVRRDHRHVFSGEEKRIIQQAPASPEAVAVVKRLLARKDIEQPGTFLELNYGIRGEDLKPAIQLDDYRFTFFVWLDRQDALRCSIDRAHVVNLRLPEDQRQIKPVSEVELAVYPRIKPEVARDPRVVQLITVLKDSLCRKFGVTVTTDIKYQRSAKVLGIA